MHPRMQACMHARTHARCREHTRTHACTRARTHTPHTRTHTAGTACQAVQRSQAVQNSTTARHACHGYGAGQAGSAWHGRIGGRSRSGQCGQLVRCSNLERTRCRERRGGTAGWALLRSGSGCGTGTCRGGRWRDQMQWPVTGETFPHDSCHVASDLCGLHVKFTS